MGICVVVSNSEGVLYATKVKEGFHKKLSSYLVFDYDYEEEEEDVKVTFLEDDIKLLEFRVYLEKFSGDLDSRKESIAEHIMYKLGSTEEDIQDSIEILRYRKKQIESILNLAEKEKAEV